MLTLVVLRKRIIVFIEYANFRIDFGSGGISVFSTQTMNTSTDAEFTYFK